MKKSLDEIIQKIELEKNSKKLQEQLTTDEIFKQRERQRIQYLRDCKMYESLSQSNSPSSAAAGGKKLITTIGTTVGWILQYSLDTYSNDPYYLQSVAFSLEGEIYTIANGEYSNSVLRKIDVEGNLIWERTLLGTGSDDDFNGADIKVGPDGSIYVIYETAVRKLDSEGGIIWTTYNQWTISEAIFIGCAIDPVLPRLYVTFVSNTQSYVVLFDSDNGDILSERYILPDEVGMGTVYCNAAPVVNSEGLLQIPVDWQADGGSNYNTTIFTMGLTSSNEDLQYLLSNTIRQVDVGVDQDSTAFCIDSSDNLYSNGYGTTITKIGPNGDHLWSKFHNVPNEWWFGTSVTTSGDVYWVGTYQGNGIVVTKLSTDGVHEWSYLVTHSEYVMEFASFWDKTQAGTAIKGDKLLFTGAFDDPSATNAILFYLGTDLVTGTFGEFTFTNITGDVVLDDVVTTDSGVNVYTESLGYLSIYSSNNISPYVDQTVTKTTVTF